MKNKTIVITGAGNGIGRAWALKFHQEQAHVVAADIDIKSLASLSDIGISTKNVDVRDSTQVTEYNFGRTTLSGNSWQEMWGTFAFTYLDTHGADGSTAVTYKTQYKANSSNVQAYVNRQNYGSPAVITSRSNIQLLEVAA